MRRIQAVRSRRDAGQVTAEYAVGTVAACGFAGVLLKALTSDGMLGLITNIISKALGFGFG